ncbi:MAG: zf-HC2 domain-containing protein [Chloroflexota bacterium]|nr:zf-HC2 domain-containing protein [Chloroflexota bacterium]
MRLFGEGFGVRHCSTETVSSFLDGAMRDSEMRKVESHLASCYDCAQQVDDMRAVVGALRTLPTVPTPRSFAVPVPARAFVAAPARPWWRPAPAEGFRAMAAAAAIALAVVFAGDISGAIGTPQAPIQLGIETPGDFINSGTPPGPEQSPIVGPEPAPEPNNQPADTVPDDTATTPAPQSTLAQQSGVRLELWALELALLALTAALAGISILARRRSLSA